MGYSTENDLLTLPEAAKMLRLKVSTLWAWRLAKKHLTFRKIGGKAFVRREDVNRFIDDSEVAPVVGELPRGRV